MLESIKMSDNPFSLEIERLKECPVCGSKDFFYEFTLNGMLKYNRCRTCECRFLSPRMTDKQTEKYYHKLYREIMLKKNVDWEEKEIYMQQLRAKNAMEMYLQNIVEKDKGLTHLDVGCAAGYMLEEAKQAGFMSHGIEPDEYFRNKALGRGLTVTPDLAHVIGSYHLITFLQVLEHFNHPKQELEKYLEHLWCTPSGGYVIIEVPNADAANDAYLMHHPVAYREKTIYWLAHAVGLKPVAVRLYGVNTPLAEKMLFLFRKDG
jgi:2-polyprenyl-3-methyl-5-hydroxy-6-metoxy-1,4-benzoquinol methylase